jgi:hypothetical protein
VIGHGEHATGVVLVGVALVELVLERLAPIRLAAMAGSGRIAALCAHQISSCPASHAQRRPNHEARNEPVPYCICVPPLLREHDEVVAGLRGAVGVELDVEVAKVGDEPDCAHA